jgi:hypothetical protein
VYIEFGDATDASSPRVTLVGKGATFTLNYGLSINSGTGTLKLANAMILPPPQNTGEVVFVVKGSRRIIRPFKVCSRIGVHPWAVDYTCTCQ